MFEKACALLSLLLWCTFGLLLYPRKDWLFWSMAAVVGVGLVSGLLLGSTQFAGPFFRSGQTIAPKKLLAQLGPLSYSWQDELKYCSSNPVEAFQP